MSYKQVGVIALRRPDGSFCESIPIYKETTPADEVIAERSMRDITDIFLEKFREVAKSNQEIQRCLK